MRYLFRISFGPVQDFIAAARKTNDLKQGSKLLADLGGELAQFIVTLTPKPTLIFPHEETAPCANILQFSMDTNEPGAVIESVRTRAIAYLKGKWNRCADKLQARNIAIKKQVGADQIEQFLEFFGAYSELANGYEAAQAQLGTNMASRKALRDFQQPHPYHKSANGTWFRDGEEIPKSSLLPEFETVLQLEGTTIPKGAAEELLLKQTEYLDAISILKRDDETPFPSTVEIALQGYIRPEAQERAPSWLKEAKRILEAHDHDLADLFFGDNFDRRAFADEELVVLDKIKAGVLGSDKPRPYFAVLHADGDGIGAKLSGLKSEQAHQEFSRLLASEFSQKAGMVVKKYGGTIVYAGGDDVLALLPASGSLDCADDLQELFSEAIPGCTLSAGIAICHVTENLQTAVGYAIELEDKAKAEPGKHAVGIGVFSRGSKGLTEVFHFKEGAESGSYMLCVLDLKASLAAFQGKGIPRGLPYELASEADTLEAVSDIIDGEYVRASAKRIFKKKQLDESQVPSRINCHGDLARFARMLRIAHFLTRGQNNG